jgi:ABC-2 type transport system ATP-binding protein
MIYNIFEWSKLMIEIKNVTKKYGDKVAVNNVTFDVNDGHNGAGKTTLIKSIVGIHDFNEGDILINGKSIKTNPVECKKDMAFVPDNPELYDNMKAIDFINFICDMYEVSLEVRKRNIEKYATMFEIKDKLNEPISSFSHGMKQKVALISALAHDPKILIMDEPFVGLDPKAVFDVKEVMNEMVKEKKTIFFSTHILDVAEKLCSRVAIIKNGKLMKVGNMKEIKGDKSLEKVFLELEK